MISLLCATVMLMGAIQVAMGVAGLGKLAKFVPQPVLAGFMNGVALSILINQLPPLLALPLATSLGVSTLGLAKPLSLVVGVGTAVAFWLTRAAAPRAPAVLVALLLGSALSFLLMYATFGALALRDLFARRSKGVDI